MWAPTGGELRVWFGQESGMWSSDLRTLWVCAGKHNHVYVARQHAPDAPAVRSQRSEIREETPQGRHKKNKKIILNLLSDEGDF